MKTYTEQMKAINELDETFTWDDLQPLHKNENCENLRELAAAKLKKKRLDAGAEDENDNTKCLIVKKILNLSDAIEWRLHVRNHEEANVNSVSLGAYLKLIGIKDAKTQMRAEDMLIEAVRHDCNPFSLQRLHYPGITLETMDDIVEFCTTGNITLKPADTINLTPQENVWLRKAIGCVPLNTDYDMAMFKRIGDKLINVKRYGWYFSDRGII